MILCTRPWVRWERESVRMSTENPEHLSDAHRRSVHKAWYDRGYLPHFDAANTYQSITYRLADSLPTHVVTGYEEELRHESEKRRRTLLRQKIDRYLDAGHGSCLLGQGPAAQEVLDAWADTDGSLCRVFAAVVMPNHVHVLAGQLPGHPLHKLINRWKSQSARVINSRFRRRGCLWTPGYWDRYIRDVSHWATYFSIPSGPVLSMSPSNGRGPYGQDSFASLRSPGFEYQAMPAADPRVVSQVQR